MYAVGTIGRNQYSTNDHNHSLCWQRSTIQIHTNTGARRSQTSFFGSPSTLAHDLPESLLIFDQHELYQLSKLTISVRSVPPSALRASADRVSDVSINTTSPPLLSIFSRMTFWQYTLPFFRGFWCRVWPTT